MLTKTSVHPNYMVNINPLGHQIGAEVVGLDLTQPVEDTVRDALYAAFLQHLVLVIRDQHFTPAQYRDAMCLFGEPMRQHRAQYNMEECPDVSIVTNLGGFGKADMWHTDHTNHEVPPKITALYGVTVPTSGGATWFTNTYAGLDSLPAEEQAELSALFTLNDMENTLSYTEADRARHPGGVRHPLVRTHPETGKRSLYFHITKSQRIEGMADDNVRPMLQSLLDRTVQEDWIYRHNWRPGDLVMTDNRCTMHRVEHDYPPGTKRLLWRMLIKGDRPQ